MTYRIIALDPGPHTGWATYTANREGLNFHEEKWNWGQLTGADRRHELEVLLQYHEVHEYTVVCESFQHRNDPGRAKVDTDAVGDISIVERICSMNGYRLIMQTPAMAKGFVKDSNIKTLGLWFPGKEWRHARDAQRHLLYYMCVTLGRSDLLRKAWR